MGVRGLAWTVVVVVVAAGVFAAYAPDSVEKMSPALGPYAHELHDVAAGGAKVPAAAPQAEAQGPPPALVSIALVKRVDYPVYLDSLGQVQAYNTVTVRTRVDGQVMKIAFVEGQMVKAGDLLAQIDPRPSRPTLDQAKAKKTQDEANLANAKLDQQRYSTLAKQSFATQQQLDTQNALVAQLTAHDRRRFCVDRRGAGAAGLYDDPRADHRAHRLSPHRRGQYRRGRATNRDRDDRAIGADLGHLHRA